MERQAAWRSPLPGECPSPRTAKCSVKEQVSPHPTAPWWFWKGSLCVKLGTLTCSFFHPCCFRLMLYLLVTLHSRGYYLRSSEGASLLGRWDRFWSRAESTLSSNSSCAEHLSLFFFVECAWKVSETLPKTVLVCYFGIKFSETPCILHTHFPDNLITKTVNY